MDGDYLTGGLGEDVEPMGPVDTVTMRVGSNIQTIDLAGLMAAAMDLLRILDTGEYDSERAARERLRGELGLPAPVRSRRAGRDDGDPTGG